MAVARRVLLAGFSLFAFAVPAGTWAQGAPVRPALDASPADLVRFAEDALVEAGVRDWAVAVIHNGRLAEQRFSPGIGGGQTVDAGTMFNLQSVAKPVIAWGVMSLVEVERLDLDRPIESYLSRWRLPPSRFDHRAITVRRVLSHTAGLSWGRRQQFASDEALPPLEDVLSGADAEGRQLEVIAEPGTRFIYSSGGYTLLQLLIEEVSGRPFAEFMEDEVLGPVGMDRSVFTPDEPDDAPVTRIVDGMGGVVESDRVATATGFITNLDELTAFALAHLEGEPGASRGRGVLQPHTLDSMLTPVVAAQGRRGLGYSVRRLSGDLLVAGHSGGGGDFRVVPATGDGLVILTNSTRAYIPIERIRCVWSSWLERTEERCPMPASHALLGAYRRAGVPGALDYYSDLVERGDPDYLVGLEQLSEFARLFIGAGKTDDAATVYRFMAENGTGEGSVYEEVADRLVSGSRLPADRLPCYLGEYRSSSGDTIRLEPTGDSVTVMIDPTAGIGGPVRPLTDRVFLFDFGGFIGELVFDLAESGVARRVTVREGTFGITVTAERSGEGGICDATATADTVHVAPPAGEMEADRTSILAALERARPWDTVLFAPGTYLVGELIRLETPRLTLLGHPEGTVLRGCHPEEYEANEREALGAGDAATGWRVLSRCGMLELIGGHVTVRDLTFEYSRLGLVLGCCEEEDVLRSAEGGYLIEGNTFRNSGNSIRAILSSSEPTVIRRNRFINTVHALSGGVSRVHMLDNEISVPEPERVPGTGHPGFAIGIRPPYAGPADQQAPAPPTCQHNIIADNRVVGHPDGILLRASPGTRCRGNTIRGNTIDVRRVPIPDDWVYADVLPLPAPGDSTFVGIPLGLINIPPRSGSAGEGGEEGRLEDNLVEGNRIVGADGLGIEVLGSSRNHFCPHQDRRVESRSVPADRGSHALVN